MKNPAVFFGAIIVAIIAALLAIYYAIPSIPHVLTFSGPMGFHTSHVILFVVITIICVVAALATRPKAAAK